MTSSVGFLAEVLEAKFQLGRSLTRRWELRRPSTEGKQMQTIVVLLRELSKVRTSMRDGRPSSSAHGSTSC